MIIVAVALSLRFCAVTFAFRQIYLDINRRRDKLPKRCRDFKEKKAP